MDRKYWVGLSLVQGVGSVRIKRLLEYFGSPERAWKAREEELLAIPSFGPKLVKKFIKIRDNVDLERFIKKCREAEIGILCFEDSEFPVNLKHIYDPPPVIYYRGSLKKEDINSIAIVGSRKMSPYGRRVTRLLARELAERGFTIISGMALGVDGEAHMAALEAGGRTIAVLGSGVDIIYPKEHKKLYQKIITSGAVISTFPPGTPPERGNFPARNRIISGLAYGTVVVEAGLKSGALITADQALEQNREVFAVPGSIFSPMSKGTNALIQKGAKLVTCSNDILEELVGLIPEKIQNKKISMDEIDEEFRFTNLQAQIMALLKTGEMSLDQLIEELNVDPARLNTALFELELLGKITQLPGLKFAIV
ncbi:DNA protecting protein DprA [Anoxybacter fermentans]|uniref:DNA protecting protein DprA n=1 Tax=Anoxybacter fermentans TaxID=1323375 RepID=A0A3Q9HPB7_9FIRM|nr:DNA-processing protein DprA [Anoxybacter fermentans]AZR72360.1 DNA protecting protein DprA [Anoxybacter fermentans]